MEENKNSFENEPKRPVQQDQFFGNPQGQNDEDLEPILKAVAVCVPIVGAVLYFMNKDKAPKKAKSACTFALIGLGVTVVFYIIYFIFIAAAAASGGY